MKKLIPFRIVFFILHSLFFIFFSAFPQSSSPYYHQIYSATSADGFNWTKQNVLLFDHSSVPGSVIDTNGTIFLYFDYFSSTSFTTETLMVASSTDGITFSTPQEVQISGSAVTRRVDPTALLLPDGTIRLFYIDFDATPYTKDVHSATSTDGINFVEDAGIRFTKEPITDPDVYSIGDTMWAMYVAYWGNGLELVRAKSTDGLTFVEDTAFFFDTGAISATMQFDTLFRTYYCGDGIESFLTDGKTITVESGKRIDGPVCDPTVIQMPDNTYMMFYKYITSGSEIEEANSLNLICIHDNSADNFIELKVSESIAGLHPTFTIYSILGDMLYTKEINQSYFELYKEYFSAGVYLYELSSKDQSVLTKGKIIIQ